MITGLRSAQKIGSSVYRLATGLYTVGTKGVGLGAAKGFSVAAVGAGLLLGDNSIAKYEKQRLISTYGTAGKLESESTSFRTVASMLLIGGGIGVGLKSGATRVEQMLSSKKGISIKKARKIITSKEALRDAKTKSRLTKKGRVVEPVKDTFRKKHPFIAVAMPLGAAGGMIGGAAYSFKRSQSRRGAMEGQISSVRGFQYGSMAPSLQFANTQGMFKKLSRRGNRRN